MVWNIIEAKKKITGSFYIKFGFRIEKSDEHGVYYFEKLKIRVVNSKDITRKIRINSIQYIKRRFLFVWIRKLKPKMFTQYETMKTFSNELKISEEYVFNFDRESLKWLRPDNIERMRIVIADNTGKKYYSKYIKLPERYELEMMHFSDNTMLSEI